MTTTTVNRKAPLILQGRTAAELMTTSPRSLRHDETVADAAAFLRTRGFADGVGRNHGPVCFWSEWQMVAVDEPEVARRMTAAPEHLAPRGGS